MIKKFIKEEYLSWVPEGYNLEDNSTDTAEWSNIKNLFRKEFIEFKDENQEDYEFPEWHYETRCLSAHLYNEHFFRNNFIRRIEKILTFRQNWIAKFECFDNNLNYIGMLMFWNGNIHYTSEFSESGFLKRIQDGTVE